MTTQDTARRLSELTPDKLDLFLERRKSRAAATDPGVIERRPRQHEPPPASFGQERLWLLDQLDPGSPAYNIPTATLIEGRLSPLWVSRVLDRIVERHQVLRTRFELAQGTVRQQIAARLRVRVPVIDLCGLAAAARAAQRGRLSAEEKRRPFALARGPLVRACLLRLADREHLLQVTIHHIVCDGWSIAIFSREFSALYRALATGEPDGLPALALDYADFAVWQRQWLTGERLAHLVGAWREALAELPPLELPTDRPRGWQRSSEGAALRAALPAPLAPGVRALGNASGATPFMVLLTAFHLLLARFAGQDDFGVGTFIAGRNRKPLEPLIGFFVNNLVLRHRSLGHEPFADSLARLQRTTLAAYANQELPFEKLLAELEVERDARLTPIFQVSLNFQSFPRRTATLPDLTLRHLELLDDRAHFDLTLWAEDEQGLDLRWVYSTALFDAATIERLAAGFGVLLQAAVADPTRPVADLPLLSAAMREQLLAGAGAEAEAQTPEVCLHQLFRQQAERTPDATAVVAGEQALSYGELAARSGRLARELAELGIGAECAVGLWVERGPGMLVAMLGILAAGGYYVPVDPSTPLARLAFLLNDTRARALVAEPRRLAALGGLALDLPVLDVAALDVAAPEVAVGDGAGMVAPPFTQRAVAAGQLAYAIYTSGSTGEPKGVMVEHRAAASYGLDFLRRYHLGAGDRVLQFASLSFDASVEEVFPALACGATLVLRDDLLAGTAPDFLASCERLGVTVLDLPTAYWHQIAAGVEAGLPMAAAVRLVILGGEAALPARVEGWLQRVGPRPALVNTYGPTEAVVVATACDLGTALGVTRPVAHVPIGRPVAQTTAYVLDRRLEPVIPGAPGELLLGGPRLARGYLRRPRSTAERFVPDPFSARPGGRLYRSGDLVRQQTDGNLLFLGRIDRQVKVRGFRVELGEIEAWLRLARGVSAAVVVLREVTSGDSRLVAYAACPGPEAPTATEAKSHLAATLPPFMVPSAIVVLHELPLTAAGKVDRRALPAPEGVRPELDSAYLAPRTPLEEIVAGVWAEVLGIERVGIEDTFFDLGGHSLLATQMLAHLRSALRVDVPLHAFFEAPTVAGLAARVRRGEEREVPPIEPVSRQQPLPLSFAQERLWYLIQLDPTDTSYHVPRALTLTGPLEVRALKRACDALVARQEILRATFPVSDGRPMMRIHAPRPMPLPVIELAALEPAERAATAQRLVLRLGRKPFDLARGPLLRARLLRLAAQEHVWVHAEHHLVHDGWTQGVFVRDLLALFAAERESRPADLPPLPIQYADFAAWQRRHIDGAVLERQLAYWRRQLAGAPEDFSALPTDRPRPAVRRSRGAEIAFRVPAALTAALLEVARRNSATLFMVMLAAFDALLWRYSRQDDLVVGTGIANRDHHEIENLIGMVINTLPLRSLLDAGLRFDELLQRVREVCLGAYAHQDVPFGKLVEELKPQRSLSHTPLFQLMFAFNDAPAPELEIPGLSIEPWSAHNRSAKFDLLMIATPEATPAGREVVVLCEYDSDLFDATTAERMIAHLLALLTAASASPERALSQLGLLSASERWALLAEWNDSARPSARPRTMHELFAGQAALRPEAVALVSGEEAWSYMALAGRVEELAWRLRAWGVGPEVAVGVALERSTALVEATLAVTAAGGVYVPLDASYPAERLSFLVADAGVDLVLVNGATAPGLAGLGVPCRTLAELVAEEPAERVPLPAVDPEGLLYVMYTSGSTGKPKGVAVPQRAVARLVTETDFATLDASETWLHLAPASFDAATLEIWGPLANGGRLVLMPPGPFAVEELAAEVERHRVTSLWLTAGLFHQTVEAVLPRLAGLRRLLAGGDVLAPSSVERVAAMVRGPWLINGYGPTENTTFTCCFTAPPQARFPGSVPIGRPIANSEAYVLDGEQQPMPIGVPGELHAGGPGLARGYHGRPGLTAERFVPDGVSGRSGARLYRTGDQARLLASGEIEFLGRRDSQVKLRGFRIELGEIEAALCALPQVAAAAAMVRHDAGTEPRLAAYLVPSLASDAGVESDGWVEPVKAALAARLPAFMRPSVWVVLPELPLSSHGKVDRAALPAPRPATRGPGAVAEPLTPTEEELAALWRELLHLGELAAGDNFFDLGGHSLLATQLLSRIARHFGVELPLRALYEGPTLGELALAVEDALLSQLEPDALAATLEELELLSDDEAESLASGTLAGRGFAGRG